MGKKVQVKNRIKEVKTWESRVQTARGRAAFERGVKNTSLEHIDRSAYQRALQCDFLYSYCYHIMQKKLLALEEYVDNEGTEDLRDSYRLLDREINSDRRGSEHHLWAICRTGAYGVARDMAMKFYENEMDSIRIGFVDKFGQFLEPGLCVRDDCDMYYAPMVLKYTKRGRENHVCVQNITGVRKVMNKDGEHATVIITYLEDPRDPHSTVEWDILDLPSGVNPLPDCSFKTADILEEWLRTCCGKMWKDRHQEELRLDH